MSTPVRAETAPAPSALDLHHQQPMTAGRALLLALLGVGIGTWSTLCGIGGGVFAVPLLHYLFGMSLKAAVANSLVVVAVMTSGGTVFELLRDDSALHWDVVIALSATSIVGSRIGYAVAERLDVRTLKAVFAALLVLVATQVLWTSSGAADGALVPRAFAPDAFDYALVAAVGLAAGFVAPLLGIGGGLVAVPGLLLGVAELGYVGARACSTAMSTVNGWQSVALYRRRGGIHAATAIACSAGAVLGARFGVVLAHRPGIASFAQGLVALTLYLVAGRFAWDLRSPSRG